ncbi:MAG: hypothetical protein E7243_19205 [Lacrimispora celerecrescens]|uniref:Uncharacterized protein n=1 Tax=Lacrimispora saccharolytica (strain ATCC 35040 / DSM 2544 / NRCC 2533 / WM1) TaxID=610130 RepID=D9R2R8_LACSW|nr:hypothetical protein [Lacrimispora saccharolytica]ADL06692.1 hypothetical protein Closa_4190 [[Clostridium] saccharolyticum WM1]MBE7721615.1 hypothetical protein [Lacrimispora celerecrescens]QRV19240.1 hypothetical protein I6K70_17515 [Lacrimispora saccharolytica]
MGYYTVVLMCVVGLLAYHEIITLKRVIRNQEERLSQLEKLMKSDSHCQAQVASALAAGGHHNQDL